MHPKIFLNTYEGKFGCFDTVELQTLDLATTFGKKLIFEIVAQSTVCDSTISKDDNLLFADKQVYFCMTAGLDTIFVQIYMDALPGVPGVSKN